MKNLTLTLALLLMVFSKLVSQDFTTIQETTSNSDLVIEGKVTSKTSFWNSDHSKILTANRIEVNKIFKGNVASELTLITEGGVVGNDFQFVTHSFQVPENKAGLYFLKSSNPYGEEGAFGNSEQSFIGFDYQNGLLTAFDGGKKYNSPERDLYNAIKEATGTEFFQVKENEIEKGIRKWFDANILKIT